MYGKALFTTKTYQANSSYYCLHVYAAIHVNEMLVEAKAYIKRLLIFLLIPGGVLILMHLISLILKAGF